MAALNPKLLTGSVLSYYYTHLIGNLPSHSIRVAYLKAYLAKVGAGTSVQMGCRFLNGRKAHLGDRNVINFGCLFDGRHYKIQTGSVVTKDVEPYTIIVGSPAQFVKSNRLTCTTP
ncbi:hypothetical protein [Trichocoleus sp. FACHB-262]|uniref:acyltransferase n=1 Tax=Trichocoleus sp. FACHB-262 TaxID=2692869 RepID=UPI0018F04DCB|nr:hypothetical protein [Trichocoleus sp. FACHB-262]